MVQIHLNRIRILSIILLALPVFVFFLFWIKPIISIPACILLGCAVWFSRSSKDKILSFKLSHLITIAAIVVVWVFLSGQGGFFTQSYDQYYRNPLFRDLVNYDWPVRYSGEGNESLVYYVGYWLIPALFGKLLGFMAARIAVFLWCSLLIFLSILLLCFLLNQTNFKNILIISAVFVLFSGMDAIGVVLFRAFDTHVENWAAVFVYNSMAIQLTEAFNQTVPAWLAISLTLNEENEKSYALIGLLLLSSSPLPLVGLVILMVYRACKNLVADYKKHKLTKRIRTIISPTNILAPIVLVPIYWMYYNNNIAIESGVSVSSTTHNVPTTSVSVVIVYIAFILLEFGLLLISIANKKNMSDAIFVGIGLALIPFFHIGWSTDFCMRVSIPFLYLLMVMLMEHFLSEKTVGRVRQDMAIIIFLIGTCTAISQYGIATRLFIETRGKSANMYDTASGLKDLTLEEKGNFIGVDSDNTLFYKYLARIS